MAKVRLKGVKVSDAKVKEAVRNAENLDGPLGDAVQRVTAQANALSSGYRTGRYHRNHESPAVGNTQPRYEGDVADRGKGKLGIVHPANYAAMKDNHENNTLLKSL